MKKEVLGRKGKRKTMKKGGSIESDDADKEVQSILGTENKKVLSKNEKKNKSMSNSNRLTPINQIELSIDRIFKMYRRDINNINNIEEADKLLIDIHDFWRHNIYQMETQDDVRILSNNTINNLIEWYVHIKKNYQEEIIIYNYEGKEVTLTAPEYYFEIIETIKEDIIKIGKGILKKMRKDKKNKKNGGTRRRKTKRKN